RSKRDWSSDVCSSDLDSVTIFDGARVNLFERVDPAPYARVVPGAVKTDSATVIPALIDTRMDFSRIVLFTTDQPVIPEPLKKMRSEERRVGTADGVEW